jgi:hypothetical protein
MTADAFRQATIPAVIDRRYKSSRTQFIARR